MEFVFNSKLFEMGILFETFTLHVETYKSTSLQVKVSGEPPTLYTPELVAGTKDFRLFKMVV